MCDLPPKPEKMEPGAIKCEKGLNCQFNFFFFFYSSLKIESNCVEKPMEGERFYNALNALQKHGLGHP